MRIENGYVILEKKDCNCTRDDRLENGMMIDRFEAKLCPKCKGTGKRGNGRCRECNARDGYWSNSFPRTPGYVADYSKFSVKVCSHCNGAWHNFDDENLTDNLDADILREIPIRVVRKPNRPITFNESHLGFGTVYSIVDYGRSRDWTDEQYAEAVRKDMDGFASSQACKYADRKTMRLCDEIVVVTSDQGFSAWPNWTVKNEI
jgi:hypothetical protein